MNRKSRSEHFEAQRWLVPGAGNKSATLSLRQTESEQSAQRGAEDGEKPTRQKPLHRSKLKNLNFCFNIFLISFDNFSTRAGLIFGKENICFS